MPKYKPTDSVYVCRTVKSFGQDNWHGPITYAEAERKKLFSDSSGTVHVTVMSEADYDKWQEHIRTQGY
jgi:hypothetical protein